MNATRNKPKCKQDCVEHVFQLKNNNGTNKYNVAITFCPKFRRDPHPPQKTIPQYNKDSKFFTHAFVLGTEKKVIASNTQHQYMHFQTMIKDACEKNNQIFFPRPNQKNCYCSVCKEHFRNYHEHIRSESHRTKIDAAIYNTEIKRLCDFYKKQWEGAHAKADQIVAQLIRQSELLQKGITSNDNDDKQQMEDEENQENEEPEQQEQNVQEMEGQQKQKLDEQNEQNQNQEEIQDQNMEEQSEQQAQKQIPTDNKKQKYVQIEKTKKKEKDKQFEQELLIAGNKASQIGDSDNNLKNRNNNSSNSFIEKKSELIVYLRKNKNGKYQIVKDVEKYIKQPSVTAPEEKQQRIQAQKQERIHKQKIEKLEKQKSKQQDKKYKRDLQKDKYYVIKQGKEHREIHKIKHPPCEKQEQSEYKDNEKSYSYSSEKGLCQNLKDRITKDRIRTRNQLKDHEQKQKGEGLSKEKSSEGMSKPREDKNSSNGRQMQSSDRNRERYAKNYQQGQMPRQNPIHMPPYMYGQGHPQQPNMSMQMNQSRNMSPGGQKMRMRPPNYSMYPPYPPQGQQMPNKPMSNDPNAMRHNPYMPPYQMMNPPPYYNPGMMGGYNMPPQPPQMRGESAPKHDQKYKQMPPQQYPPVYYQNPWNPYMMGHPAMRPDNSKQASNQNIARQQMPPPQGPPYHMMPNNPKSPKSNTHNPNPNMNPNMNMYMQYPPQMNPPYQYMNQYAHKKGEEPRDPR